MRSCDTRGSSFGKIESFETETSTEAPMVLVGPQGSRLIRVRNLTFAMLGSDLLVHLVVLVCGF